MKSTLSFHPVPGKIGVFLTKIGDCQIGWVKQFDYGTWGQKSSLYDKETVIPEAFFGPYKTQSTAGVALKKDIFEHHNRAESLVSKIEHFEKM